MCAARIELPAFGKQRLTFTLDDVSDLTPGVTPLSVEPDGDWRGVLAGELRLFAGSSHNNETFILAACDVVVSAIDDQLCNNIVRFIKAGIEFGTFDGNSPLRSPLRSVRP